MTSCLIEHLLLHMICTPYICLSPVSSLKGAVTGSTHGPNKLPKCDCVVALMYMEHVLPFCLPIGQAGQMVTFDNSQMIYMKLLV